MRRILLVLVVCALGASAPRTAAAFCGFYVAGAEDALYSISLTSMLAQPLPPDIAVDRGEPIAEESDPSAGSGQAQKTPAKVEPPETEKKGGGGCGCRTVGSVGGGLWLALLIAWAWRRRRS